MWGKKGREAERASQRAGSQVHLPSAVNIPLTGVARTRRLWGDGGEGKGHEEMRVPFPGYVPLGWLFGKGDWTTEREQNTPRKM